MNAEEFDRLFDEGVDMADHLDLTTLRRPNLEPERVSVELPVWVVRRLDDQARVAGVTRDEVIKLWLAERLQAQTAQPVAAE